MARFDAIRSSLCLLALCALAPVGCGTGTPSDSPLPGASPPPTSAAAAPTVAPALKEAPKPSIEDTTFRLALEGDPQYTAGQPGTLKLVLQARGGYHVNQDYPIRVELKAPAGVKLAKPSLTKPDAAQFGEESARFDVGFSADKGTHDLSATVDFAVCTKETCVPDQRTVAIALAVQ